MSAPVWRNLRIATTVSYATRSCTRGQASPASHLPARNIRHTATLAGSWRYGQPSRVQRPAGKSVAWMSESSPPACERARKHTFASMYRCTQMTEVEAMSGACPRAFFFFGLPLSFELALAPGVHKFPPMIQSASCGRCLLSATSQQLVHTAFGAHADKENIDLALPEVQRLVPFQFSQPLAVGRPLIHDPQNADAVRSSDAPRPAACLMSRFCAYPGLLRTH